MTDAVIDPLAMVVEVLLQGEEHCPSFPPSFHHPKHLFAFLVTYSYLAASLYTFVNGSTSTCETN